MYQIPKNQIGKILIDLVSPQIQKTEIGPWKKNKGLNRKFCILETKTIYFCKKENGKSANHRVL